VKDGRLTGPFIVTILTRCLERAETAGQLDSVEKAIKPLCEAAKVPEKEFMKFAELLPAAEDRLAVPAA